MTFRSLTRTAKTLAVLLLVLCGLSAYACSVRTPEGPSEVQSDTTASTPDTTQVPEEDTQPAGTEVEPEETTIEKAELDDHSLLIAKKDLASEYSFSFHCEKGKMSQALEFSEALSELTGSRVFLDSTVWEM